MRDHGLDLYALLFWAILLNFLLIFICQELFAANFVFVDIAHDHPPSLSVANNRCVVVCHAVFTMSLKRPTRATRASTSTSEDRRSSRKASSNDKKGKGKHKTQPDEVVDDTVDEIAFCKDCNKQVFADEKAVTCDMCKLWFHTGCQDVPKVVYDAINASNSTKCQLNWYCDRCSRGWSEINDKFAKVCMTQIRMEKDLNKVKKQQAESSKELKTIKEDVQNLKKAKVDTSSITASVIKELREQKQRETSIMFFNVGESEATDPEDRKAHDQSEVDKFCKDTLEMQSTPIIKKIQRVGPKSKNGVRQKSRPTKVIFKELDGANLVKTAFRDLPPEKKKKISISLRQDYTWLEREQHQKVRTECTAMQKKLEAKKIKHYRYEVIRGQIKKIQIEPRPDVLETEDNSESESESEPEVEPPQSEEEEEPSEGEQD